MGRPLNPRYFGTTVENGVARQDEENLSVAVKVGSNSVSTTGIVLRQRSETRFRVNDSPDGTGNSGVCELVDAEPNQLTDDQMILRGFISGTLTSVNIRKVHNRTMIDFANNRYKWEIQDDSTANVLVLYPV